MKKTLLIATILIAIFAFGSCASASRTVTRTSTEAVTDFSGRWNDTDSRLVSETMIEDMLYASWLVRFKSDSSREPVIITGYIKNRSSEHIETNAFIKDIERALINSGQATVVASATEREQLRTEKEDQQTQASYETVKRLGEETGADFILIGTIISQTDSLDNSTAVTYQVDLELINIENNNKVWIGTKKIKKVIEQEDFTF